MTPSWFKRWLYRGGRPNLLARVINRGWAVVHALGVAPNYLVTLEVVGRRSGRTISFPLAMVVLDGERYLVSMLGTDPVGVPLYAAGRRAIVIFPAFIIIGGWLEDRSFRLLYLALSFAVQLILVSAFAAWFWVD